MQATRLLTSVGSRAPGLEDYLKRRFVEHAVPANRSMGIRIDRIADGVVHLRLDDQRRNRNVGGTIHGGVLLALAETVHGVAVLWRFPPSHHRMVTVEARMRYLAPARGTVTTAWGLEESYAERVDDTLARTGRADLELTAKVLDVSAVVVARLDAHYRLSRRAEG